MQSVKVSIFDNSHDAERQGHVYGSDVTAVTITEAVVVRNGTLGGNATVDLVITDAAGNKYVTMITAAILSSIVSIAGGI